MPPNTPPALLEVKPSGVISSLCSVPFCATASNPAPISTPLTALILIREWAISASRRSKIGSPSPTGTFVAITEIFAPTELPSFSKSCMYCSISGTLSGSGQKNGLFSTSSSKTCSALIGPSCDKYPLISIPAIFCKYFLAMAPAATRIAVSRAEERPPPR